MSGKKTTTSTTTPIDPGAPQRQEVFNQAQNAFTNNQSASPGLNLANQIASNNVNNSTNANSLQSQQYNDLQNGISDWRTNSLTPTLAGINSNRPANYIPQNVSAPTSSASQDALRGYQDFAQTGGYSPQDIQELRARDTGPLRSAFASAQSGLDRTRALQGGYSPNYSAATASLSRSMPGQLATANTNINAGLADSIRQGKLAGLSGVTGISEADLGRQQQANLANQGAGLQANQQNTNASNQFNQTQLGAQGLLGNSFGSQTQLYGTNPGLASSFGNQVNSSVGNVLEGQGQQNTNGLGLINASLRGLPPVGQNTTGTSTQPWYNTVEDIAKTASPFVTAFA